MAEQQNQNKNANAKEQDIHQLLKVRREKLAELQAEGKDQIGRASCRERV